MGCSRTVVYKGDDPDVVVVADQHPGPPAHAPANGYRRHHPGDGVVLVYDADLQVYVVDNHPGCYYTAGQYFRWKSAWQWSVDIGGPWKAVAMESDLPHGLRTMKQKEFKEARNNVKNKKSRKDDD
jgi:hypothetical protein